MSYRYRVISDNPLGYWDLSNINSSSNYDITTASNHAFVSSNVIFSTPPLILNSGSVARITSPTASIRINNTYDAFNANSVNSTYSLEFWFHFNGLFNGNGYELNNTASGYFNNNQLDILKAINTSTGSTISKIYYDYNSNTLRYGYPGTGNSEAYYYLKNLDTPLHIVATYNGGAISLKVNNDQGYSAILYNNALINSASRLNMVQYVIDGSSINTNYSGSTSFLISNLAIYNYELSSNTIKNHLVWAGYQNDPEYFSNNNQNVDYFNLIYDSNNFLYYRKYDKFDLKNYKEEYKTAIDENGIGIKYLSPLQFISNSGGTLTVNSSSGMNWSSSADYLYFPDFGQYVQNSFSIFVQTSSSVTASNQYLFSINSVDGSNILFLQKNPLPASGYYLYYYNSSNAQYTLFASIVNPTSVLAGKENVGISYDGYNIYLYASTSSVVKSVNPFNINSNSTLILGKSNSASNMPNNTTFYSNLSIFDYEAKNYATASSAFNSNKMLFGPLTSSLTLNQYAYVIYEYPVATINKKIGGSYINWTSPDNITAKISYDDGDSWINASWNSYLKNHDNTVFQENVLVKFEFNQKYNDFYPLRLNNFEFGIYDNDSFVSDFKNYQLFFNSASSYSTQSYRNVNNKIVFRPENFGVTFKTNSSEIVPGYATAYSASTDAYGLDFWLRIDDLQTNRSSSPVYLLNTSSYSLYYTASNPVLQWASAGPIFIYINGASVSRGSYSLLQNEYYHVAISSISPVSGNININGGVANSGSYNANATYGYLSLWNTQPTPTDIQNRYTLFTSNFIQTASTQDNTLFLRNSSYYDSASAYKIG